MSAVASPRPSAADKRILVRPSAEVQAVEAELARLAAGSGPIVVGPWEGGVTEELLYWLPFVRWAQERFGLDRSRLIAVSRSGAGAWYDAVCAGYAESVPEGIERL